MAESYPVSRTEYPWMGGSGFLSGLPVVLLELQEGAPLTPLDAIIESLARRQRSLGARAPRWLAVLGDTRYADNDLAVRVRVHVGTLLTLVETDGTRPMWDQRSGRLPMWDHVALRARLPLPGGVVRTERYHSVVVETPVEDGMVEALHHALARDRFEGPRYVCGRGAPTAAARAGRDWRATAPLVRDEAADGAWIFGGAA